MDDECGESTKSDRPGFLFGAKRKCKSRAIIMFRARIVHCCLRTLGEFTVQKEGKGSWPIGLSGVFVYFPRCKVIRTPRVNKQVKKWPHTNQSGASASNKRVSVLAHNEVDINSFACRLLPWENLTCTLLALSWDFERVPMWIIYAPWGVFQSILCHSRWLILRHDVWFST